MSLKSSSKLRNILEVRGSPMGGTGAMGGLLGCDADLPGVSPQIVLAFGNYMNSSKRGAAYGFRLQSLDAVRWVWVRCEQAVSLYGDTPWEQRDAVICCGWGGCGRQLWAGGVWGAAVGVKGLGSSYRDGETELAVGTEGYVGAGDGGRWRLAMGVWRGVRINHGVWRDVGSSRGDGGARGAGAEMEGCVCTEGHGNQPWGRRVGGAVGRRAGLTLLFPSCWR